jgi:uncharacterized membrane protein YbhN (UPF0104 family)
VVLPLFWLSKLISLADLRAGLRALGAPRLAVALALSLLPYGFNAWRWRALLAGASAGGEPPSIARLWRFNIEGVYFSLIPSGLAADVVRGHRAAQVHVDAETSYAIIVVERFLSLGALFVAAGIARLSAPPRLPASLDVVVFAGCALTLAGTLAAPPLARRLAPAVFGKRFEALLQRLLAPRFSRALALAGSISLAGQLASIVYVWMLARAWAPDAELHAYLQVVPFAFLATFVPLTPGALGQRELAFVWLFGLVGLAPAHAVLLSLSIATLGYVLALLGALLYFADLRKVRRAEAR